MHEGVGDQLPDGDLGVEREPQPEEPVVDLLFGVVRRHCLGEFHHRTEQRDLDGAVGLDGVVLIERLEHDGMRRYEGPEHAGRPEQQRGAERQIAVDRPETESGQKIEIGEFGENSVTSARCEAPESVDFGGIEIGYRESGQRNRRQVPIPEQGRARLGFVGQHRKTLWLAVNVDRPAHVPPGGGRDQRSRLRHVDDHDIDTVEPLHGGRDTEGGRGSVGDQRLEPVAVGRLAVPGSSTDHCAVVGDAEQKPAAFPVGEAHDGLRELVVVDVALELDGIGFAASDEDLDAGFHRGTIIRICLRFRYWYSAHRITLHSGHGHRIDLALVNRTWASRLSG